MKLHEKVGKIFDKVKQEGRTNLLEEEGIEILMPMVFLFQKVSSLSQKMMPLCCK
ncbi:MAG: hypothetical protein CM1200mP23_4300 [Nitrososphaerota archaeon]|nr:MAG: hypothetical protein CM1200mP23_4300 [Nitrososphaerota archaeon]